MPGSSASVATATLLRGIERREEARRWFLILPAGLFVAVLLFFPLLRIVTMSVWDPTFTLRHYGHAFQDPVFYRVLWVTFKVSLLTTAGCLVLGYPVAHLMVHARPAVANFLMTLVLLSFWMSLLVRTYAWMVLLGRRGVINNLLLALGLTSAPLPLMYNLFGVLVGMVHVLLPFMILPLYSVMKGIDRSLVLAAQNLGAGPLRSFLWVFLPLSFPGVVGGCLLVFMISAGYFITPALLGGRTDMMLGQLIELEVSELLNWGYASALATILFVVVALLFLGYRRVTALRLLSGSS